MSGMDLAMRIVEILAWPAVVVTFVLIISPRKKKPPAQPPPPPGWHYDPNTGVAIHDLRSGTGTMTWSVAKDDDQT